MNELDLQDKYLINFLCERQDGLQYREAKANTVSPQFFLVEDLKHFLSETSLNKDNYKKLLRKYNSEKELLDAITDELHDRLKSAANMALFVNSNKSFTINGISLHLFYPSGSETYEDQLFDENIFTVIQELPYTFSYKSHDGKNTLSKFSFRPDLSFFLNGIYLGYSELKSNYTNQNARKNGRKKVSKDYLTAVQEYLKIADGNDSSQTIRKEFLKIFEKAIHITSTDVNETYVIRNISTQFEEIKSTFLEQTHDYSQYENKLEKDFKQYPVRNKNANKTERFEEVFRALYDKKMIEKEILYYNFIERELIKKENSKTKEYKHNDGRLISPRPKQKFGTDKIISKIDEFLEHESEPDYFIKKLEAELKEKGIGIEKIQELIHKRQKYQNNKNVYSLLLQYSAGFGKSNIIGWTALQLKDIRRNKAYVFDKIMLVVDRLQLRDQIDSMLHNMNIQKGMFIEAHDKKTFSKALESNVRIVVVNIQKFGTIKDILDKSIVQNLSKLRIAFLIDEIHRSNDGLQNEEMLSIFDELQNSFDKGINDASSISKKNLIVGFTATPSDHTLSRFGEFSHYAENKAIWVPFDYYTMGKAIEDGYILNPIKGIVPVSAKMYFEKPENALEGFEGDTGYEEIPDGTDTGVDAEGKKYAIRKKKIYADPERIEAISKFIVDRLVSNVYIQIRSTAKAMLATTSIPNAIKYTHFIKKYLKEVTQLKKYERFKDTPVYIVYSDSQEHPSSSSINDGLSEKTVLQNFKLAKNGIIIVVDKLQTGYDEPKLHTLFLDKEIRGINAIQTISRVNRTTKHKNDCKIVDFSYKNVNVKNIKDAFEHFSNVVVSDFDPLGQESNLEIYYKSLKETAILNSQFPNFVKYHEEVKDIQLLLEMQNCFSQFITNNKAEAKQLKKVINKYFSILNLIEFVIDLDTKFSETLFLDFLRKFNNEYNNINRSSEIIDDVEIYFDNKIGIVAPQDYIFTPKVNSNKVSQPDGSSGYNKYRYNILRVIEKRNQEEEAIAVLIKEFEQKVDNFFAYIKEDELGKRLVAKILDDGNSFSQDEINHDFSKIYRKYTILNKDLGDFFKRETKDSLPQLCDDFERSLSDDFQSGFEIPNRPIPPKK